MSTSTTINLQDRLEDLFSYIREGRILDAINEFYAEDAAMQENNLPPTVGREANYEREKQFLSMVKEWKGFDSWCYHWPLGFLLHLNLPYTP